MLPMKIRCHTACCYAFLLLMSLWLFSCRNTTLSAPDAMLALQPLNHYSKERTTQVQQDLERFFHKKVVVLPARTLPDAFINNEKGKRYAAGEIIRWLSEGKPDSVSTVIGLIDEDIFVTKKDAAGVVKKPESTYAVWGIFGLGYRPGNACVVSEKRLWTADAARFRHRLRTVVLHETGHNLGLPHCPHPGCIMSDANERIATIDQSGNDYCPSCRKKAALP